MHDADRIDRVQEQPLEGANVLFRQAVVIVGIGIRDTRASGRYAVKPSFIEGSMRTVIVPGRAACAGSIN